MNTIIGNLRRVLLGAALFFFLDIMVWLPIGFAPPVIIVPFAGIVLTSLVVWLLTRKKTFPKQTPLQLAFTVLATIGLILLVLFLIPDPGADRYHPAGYDLWLKPGEELKMVNGTVFHTDVKGLRVTPQNTNGEGGVALVGDSYVFGTGVADDETIANQFARRLQAARGPSYSVHNLGLPGASLASFDDLMRYAQTTVAPEAFVIYMKADDLVDTDISLRYKHANESFFGKFKAASGVDAIEDLYRIKALASCAACFNDAFVLGELDRVKAACRNTRCLIVSDLGPMEFDRLKRYSEIDGHLSWVALRKNELWKALDELRIPNDGHYTAEANAMFADLLMPYLDWLLPNHVN